MNEKQWMEWLRSAFKCSGLTLTQRLVLAQMAAHAIGTADRIISISVGDISQQCAISRRTAQVAMRRLEALGYIQHIPHEQPGHDNARARKYQITLPDNTQPKECA